MWNAINALKGSIIAAVLIGFGSGLVFGAAQGLFSEPDPPSVGARPSPTPASKSSCSSLKVLLIGVETSEGAFDDVERLGRLLEDEDLTPEIRRLPWRSDEIGSRTQELVNAARQADATVALLRLGTGDSQVTLASALAEVVDGELRLLVGGAAEMQTRLAELLEGTEAQHRPLSSVETASNMMSDQETTEVARWLVDGFQCGLQGSAS